MAQCEMCGTETASPRTVKIEGAELAVCGDCADFGTEVREQSSSGGSTKYSTGSSGTGSDSSAGSNESGASAGGSTAGGSGGGGSRRPDPFDDDALAQDYDQRIRQAREATGLNQADFAQELNEKASLIRKLERGDMLPSDRVQQKLERQLDIDLTEDVGDDTEWESGASTGSYTLGDVVRRKDS